MFLFKRGSIYHLEYKDVDENRTKRISTKCKSKKDALEFLSNFKDGISNRTKLRFISLHRFENEYQGYVDANFSKSYSLMVGVSFKLLTEHFGDIPLNKFPFQELEKFFSDTYQRTKQGARTYLIALKSAFNKAILWGYIDKNPFERIKLPKIPKNNPLFIQESELDDLLNLEEDELFKSIYVFAFNTGLRLGEITNLKWNAVDFLEKIISVQNTIDFTTKGKQERTIPMNESVFHLLSNRFPKVINITNDSYVFSNNVIKLNGDFISKRFKKIIRKSKLNQDLHFHDLRHSFASNLVKKGVSIFVIKELLGHQDVKTTQIYSHLTIDTLQNAVNQLGVNL
jgi:site-specific recombinase XerD